MNDHIYIPMSLYSQRVQVSELRVGNSLPGLAVASGVVSGNSRPAAPSIQTVRGIFG